MNGIRTDRLKGGVKKAVRTNVQGLIPLDCCGDFVRLGVVFRKFSFIGMLVR